MNFPQWNGHTDQCKKGDNRSGLTILLNNEYRLLLAHYCSLKTIQDVIYMPWNVGFSNHKGLTGCLYQMGGNIVATTTRPNYPHMSYRILLSTIIEHAGLNKKKSLIFINNLFLVDFRC